MKAGRMQPEVGSRTHRVPGGDEEHIAIAREVEGRDAVHGRAVQRVPKVGCDYG